MTEQQALWLIMRLKRDIPSMSAQDIVVESLGVSASEARVLLWERDVGVLASHFISRDIHSFLGTLEPHMRRHAEAHGSSLLLPPTSGLPDSEEKPPLPFMHGHSLVWDPKACYYAVDVTPDIRVSVSKSTINSLWSWYILANLSTTHSSLGTRGLTARNTPLQTCGDLLEYAIAIQLPIIPIVQPDERPTMWEHLEFL